MSQSKPDPKLLFKLTLSLESPMLADQVFEDVVHVDEVRHLYETMISVGNNPAATKEFLKQTVCCSASEAARQWITENVGKVMDSKAEKLTEGPNVRGEQCGCNTRGDVGKTTGTEGAPSAVPGGSQGTAGDTGGA